MSTDFEKDTTIDFERTVPVEKRVQRTAFWASVEPNDEQIFLGLRLPLYEPVVKLYVAINRSRQVTRILGKV